jgi:hypothetical protein
MLYMQEQVAVPPVKNLSKQKSLTDRQQVCSLFCFVFLFYIVLMWRTKFCVSKTHNWHTED